MSPRRARGRGLRDRPQRRVQEAPAGFLPAPDGWHARTVTAARAVKTYRCPGCDHEIATGTAHVVAWEVRAEDDRRHWHAACWRRRRA